MEISKHT